MKKLVSHPFSVLGIGLLSLALTVPAWAQDTASPPTADATATGPTPESVKKHKKKTDEASTPASVAAPVAPTPPVVAPIATPAPVSAPAAPATAKATTKTAPPSLPESVTKGDMTASRAHAAFSHDHIDVTLSIKNNGKIEDKITGAGTNLPDADIVEVKKDKDGKEQESSVSEIIPAGETVDFSTGKTWLRIKGVKKAPQANDILTVSLYFRHAPNIDFKMTTKEGGGEGVTDKIMDWFKK